MTGRYEIDIYNNRVHYFLTIKRNFTVLQGNSATGKTELIRLVQEHEANGNSSGITLICEAKCTVLTTVDWEIRLQSLNGNIIFIDDTAAFLKTKRFAELTKGSDNYFVLVTRDDLNMLPYSVDEIYGLRNVTGSQKYKTYKRVYNEMYRLYNFDISTSVKPQKVITEDSNSGYEFFKEVYSGNAECVSACGKGNVCNVIRNADEVATLAIVDGAAFGPEIGKIMRYLESSNACCVIFAPESFEYLILSSGLFDVPKEILEETHKFADSKQFMSWEEFYTYYLADITRNTVYQYGKLKLRAAYKKEGAVKKIVAKMPSQIVL